MKKDILYIDMDGVIADFDAGIKIYDPSLETGDGHDDYEGRSKKVYKICSQNRNIFLGLPPIEGAIQGVNTLWKYYDVYFLSTPMWVVPESYTDKRLWLEKHLGGKTDNRLILTSRKDLNIGEYLIDDRLRNGAGEFKGKLVRFGSESFPNWTPVVKYLIAEATLKGVQIW